MNTAKLSLEVTNNLDELENLSQNIDQFCRLNGLTVRNAFELNLVIDEVFTNIVSYGFHDPKKHFIKIEFEISNGVLMVRVEDDGIPFDPTAVPKTDLRCSIENRQIGGIGLHLINQLMNSIVYKRVNNKNILILKKCLDKK